jgi:hypothetical protein
MRSIRARVRAEDGSALMISFFILLAVLAFSGASFEAAIILSNATNRTTNAQEAFQAADSGIDQAVHRLALLGPASTACVYTDSGAVTTGTPTGGGTWCTSNSNETVGSGATFTYSMSTQGQNTSCVGTPSLTSNSPDRCIIATGAENGVQRRLEARLTTKGGINDQPLSDKDVKAVDSVKVESGVSISGNVSTNNKLEVSNNSTISNGSVTVGRRTKVKGLALCTATVTTNCYSRDLTTDTPVTVSMPDFGTTATAYNATTNLGGNNNSTISGTYYNPATRTLHITKNRQVTLAPGVYNFCSIVIDGRGILNLGGTGASPVKIYLDSPTRSGSGCPNNSGTLTAGGKSVMVNPSLDPTAFQFFAWGTNTRKKRSRLQLPLGKNGVLAAIIDAPTNEVRFGDNKGILVGGIVARRVVFKKNMRFISDARVHNRTTSTIVQSFRVAWKQCDSTLTSPTGC